MTRSRPSARSVSSADLNDLVAVVVSAGHEFLQADDSSEDQGEFAHYQGLAGEHSERAEREGYQRTAN